TRYGEKLGMAFQIVDDILDFEKEERPTYPAVYGLNKAREEAKRLINEAVFLASTFGEKGEDLKELAIMVSRRLG
ncbi:MAG: polyprenyl synthetase family protein, partial [Chloroflexi bacterium]|nr:polyprenyl synthetase family protein [Chloroflexota bacterium]